MIDFEKQLNPAQWEAVRSPGGPVLVIAGAGSGKTRTIVYRLAWLVGQGVAPDSILLLTFTRKAAAQMLQRASALLGSEGAALAGVQGGTFHSFAFSLLRRFPGALGRDRLTVMDQSEAQAAVAAIRDDLNLARGDKSFPKRGMVLSLISKARNKEIPLEDILSAEAFHLLPHAPAIARIGAGYEAYKAENGLLDYDDLLFGLERLLTEHEPARDFVRRRISHVMVDEYQDTNPVQARLVRLLAGEAGNVMAVGDDAQSIYAFRGADVQNILRFPKEFPGAQLVRLEQNYRSTQPILNLTNALLSQARERYDKNLFTERQGGPRPRLVRTLSDRTQAQAAAKLILELARDRPLHDISVLFRASYHAFALEAVLNRLGIKYQKFGGVRFTEAAHIKDVLAYLRLLVNPADGPAFARILEHVKGVGPKTCAGLHAAVLSGDAAKVKAACARRPEVAAILGFVDELRRRPAPPAALLSRIAEHYRPILQEKHPDDYPTRESGLEQLQKIAAEYRDAAQFLADLSLESPEEDEGRGRENALVLSTVHSAKGLEWSAVLVIDLVEERFPSRHAMNRPEDLEEERRLLYVACTRARDSLTLFVPAAVGNFSGGSDPAAASPFVAALPYSCYEEWRESYVGGLAPVQARTPAPGSFAARSLPPDPESRRGGSQVPPGDAPSAPAAPARPAVPPARLGYCRHKIFGRGKIIAIPGPDKVKVNFPGFGVKVILANFLEIEQETP
ncbi:MAG: ATP-dependent helicase [Thermodesulfobacteriota bacterium]